MDYNYTQVQAEKQKGKKRFSEVMKNESSMTNPLRDGHEARPEFSRSHTSHTDLRALKQPEVKDSSNPSKSSVLVSQVSGDLHLHSANRR